MNRSIISPPKVVLTQAMTMAEGIATLVQHHFCPLAVVDSNNRFVGVFGPREVIGALLPRAARLEEYLGELNYIADGIGDLRAHLAEIGPEPVSRSMAAHNAVSAETSLLEALFLLKRGDAFLPVVEADGTLVGVVTATDALATITNHA